MKSLIPILCLLLAGCSSAIEKITEEQIDRTYAGDIEVSDPIKTNNGIELGLTFSEGGWIRNSGICYKKSKATVDGMTIKMRVFTSACTSSTIKPFLAIHENLEGSYQLVFQDPDGTIHPLKTIEIP